MIQGCVPPRLEFGGQLGRMVFGFGKKKQEQKARQNPRIEEVLESRMVDSIIQGIPPFGSTIESRGTPGSDVDKCVLACFGVFHVFSIKLSIS